MASLVKDLLHSNRRRPRGTSDVVNTAPGGSVEAPKTKRPRAGTKAASDAAQKPEGKAQDGMKLRSTSGATGRKSNSSQIAQKKGNTTGPAKSTAKKSTSKNNNNPVDVNSEHAENEPVAVEFAPTGTGNGNQRVSGIPKSNGKSSARRPSLSAKRGDENDSENTSEGDKPAVSDASESGDEFERAMFHSKNTSKNKRATNTRERENVEHELDFVPPRFQKSVADNSLEADTLSLIIPDPPLTDYTSSDGGFNPDDFESDNEEAAPKSAKLSARSQKYKSERPSIQQAEQSVKKVKVELESDPTVLQRGKEENYATATRRQEEEDPNTHIVYPTKGSLLLKTQQPAVIIQVLNTAVQALDTLLFLDDPFPAADHFRTIAFNCLVRAAEDEGQMAIAERLVSDSLYKRLMRHSVTESSGHHRTDLKRHANKDIITRHYQLYNDKVVATSRDRKKLAKQLILSANYVYPLTNPADPESYNKAQPFCHPAIRHVLHAAFASTRNHLANSVDLLESSIDSKPTEKEIPAAMVALAGTVIYSHLKNIADNQVTGKEIAFAAATHSPEYNELRRLLGIIRGEENDKKGAKRYHVLMHKLYNDALVHPDDDTRGSREHPALEPDLDAMDVGDDSEEGQE